MAVEEEGWGVLDVADCGGTLCESDIEINFLFHIFARHIGEEFVCVAFPFCNFVEIIYELFGTLISIRIEPFFLFFEKMVAVFFPVALETGGFSGGGGGDAVLVIRKNIGTMNNGDFTIIFFHEFFYGINDRCTAGTLVIRIFENFDFCVFVAFDMIGDVAIFFVGRNNGIDVVVGANSFILVANNCPGEKTAKKQNSDNQDNFSAFVHFTLLISQCYNYSMEEGFMQKIVRWLDPKLEKYREEKPKEKFSPKTEKELVETIKNTPEKILSKQEKNMIAAVLGFSGKKVKDLMIEKEEMTFVEEDEFLGPLNLDKLYRSGFSHFPVVNKAGKIIGIIHTESLNSLEIKEAKKAKEFLNDTRVVYVKYNDPLTEVLDEFMRTNTLFYAVVDEKENLVGMLTFEMIVYYLFGKI